jgi:hypothetical protein
MRSREARLIGLLARDVEAQPDDPTRNWERSFFHLVARRQTNGSILSQAKARDNGFVFSFFWLPRERLGDLWPGLWRLSASHFALVVLCAITLFVHADRVAPFLISDAMAA